MTDRLPEVQRASRILEIISLINSQPETWTRKALAERYEISERQVTKDLDVIRHGLKLELGRVAGGGYYFHSLPKLPAVSYSLPEALAIFLASQVAGQVPGVPRQELAAAIGRLTAIMPVELRPLMSAAYLAPGTPTRDVHRERVLETLTQAIAARRCVDIVYEPASRAGARTERRVDPYAVVPNLHAWYLIGWCHLRDAVRIFKIDRIREITTADERFMPDPEFSVDEFLAAAWGMTRPPDQSPEQVELLFSTTAARWVAEEQWHPSQSLEWLDDGRLRFTVRVPVTEEFARWVMRYGRECTVVRPDSLRAWLVDQARAMIDGYAVDGAS